MRFMSFHTINEATAAAPTPEMMEEMGKFIEELNAAGVLVATGGLLPSSTGVRIRYENGERTVTDGPFVESKEVLGGFAIFETDSIEEVMGWSTRFARIIGDTTVEIRPMYSEQDPVCVEPAAAESSSDTN